MSFIALKMLFGDRAKYFGTVMGLTFASLLITQQLAIFVGLMTWMYGFVTDAVLPTSGSWIPRSSLLTTSDLGYTELGAWHFAGGNYALVASADLGHR